MSLADIIKGCIVGDPACIAAAKRLMALHEYASQNDWAWNWNVADCVVRANFKCPCNSGATCPCLKHAADIKNTGACHCELMSRGAVG